MSSFSALNTCAAERRLGQAGLPPEQARAVVESMREAMADLATRSDIERLASNIDRLASNVDRLASDMRQLERDLESKIDKAESYISSLVLMANALIFMLFVASTSRIH